VSGPSGPESASAARPARWIDSHCHLQDRYRPEATTVLAALAEAVAAGVGGVICVGTDADTSRQAVRLVRDVARGSDGTPGPEGETLGDLGMWATVGLHPHEATHGVDDVESVLVDALATADGSVVAVGECGLDYHYDHSPRAVQRDVFAAQIALARLHDLTLVVHTREAWDDTIEILRAEGPPDRLVMHCFTGGPQEARRCLDLGAYLSFSGIVTFKGADDVRAAAALCPVGQLLVETDAPFLAPVPHRGQENRPAWVAAVGEAVAVVKGVAPDVMAHASAAATGRAFAISRG
jgi:TatD DNase family protein